MYSEIVKNKVVTKNDSRIDCTTKLQSNLLGDINITIIDLKSKLLSILKTLSNLINDYYNLYRVLLTITLNFYNYYLLVLNEKIRLIISQCEL